MAEIRAAGAIVYVPRKSGQLYLLLRSTKHGGWGPPKGKADPGEEVFETASRELYEETGLRRVSFDPDFRVQIEYTVSKKSQTLKKTVVFLLCQAETEEFTLSPEHTESHLATLDEVEQLVSHEDLRAVFRRAAEHLRTAHHGDTETRSTAR